MHHLTNQGTIGYQAPDVEYHFFGYSDWETMERQLNEVGGGVAGLDVQVTEYDTDQDWARRAAYVLSNNSQPLRVLRVFNDSQPDHPIMDLPYFCIELADNRTIEHLTMSRFDLSHDDIFEILASFFERNSTLRCIEVTNHPTISVRISSLISALSLSKHLERVDLRDTHIGDDQSAELINAFISVPGLHSLLDLCLGNNKIGKRGCEALGKLLRNSVCKLQHLDLSDNDINNECINILATALTKNSSIKALDLAGLQLVTPNGWFNIFSVYLSNPSCSLVKLWLGRNEIGDAGASSLGNSFAMKNTLAHLDIVSCNSITLKGWQRFSKCLRDPNSSLVQLKLDQSTIADEGAVAIFMALAANTSVRKLSMVGVQSLSSSGWVSCFQVLLNSRSLLEELDLSDSRIGDQGATALVHLIANNMSTVRMLKVTDSSPLSSFGGWRLLADSNPPMTADGWRVFVDVLLPSSTSQLKELHLGSEMMGPETIDDDVFTRLADAMAQNSSLEVLGINETDISPSGWKAMINALSDKSSIESTLHSNHTLNCFLCTENNMPCEIQALVELNDSQNKLEVAREKIIMNHFEDRDAIVHAFGSMPEKILPNAIELLCNRSGVSAVFHLLRRMPWLLESTTKTQY